MEKDDVKKEDILNLADNTCEALSVKHSYPLWLVKRWEREFGLDFTKELLYSLNKKSPLYIRCNTLVNSIEEFKESLNNAGIEYEEVKIENFKDYNYSFKLSNIKDISRVPGFGDGSFYIQDPAASLAAYLLEPKEDDFIIDKIGNINKDCYFNKKFISNKNLKINLILYLRYFIIVLLGN